MTSLFLTVSIIFGAAALALPTVSPQIPPISNCWTVGQAVKTTSGTVSGHPSSWKPLVSEYLGIPYAQPPLGNLRFGAPQPYTSNTTISGANYGPDCLVFLGSVGENLSNPAVIEYGEASGGGTPQNPHNSSEDCLSINVWTKPQIGEANKAVMVWIYGGAFSTGTSDALYYDGARLADEDDVVVVSFNYRVNIFGFPRAPGLTDSNPGLLDQRLAVEWVRDNIAGFAGDPSRITLFGESAGGFSVDIYSYAWVDDPIVQGFIPESGTAIAAVDLGSSIEAGYADWYNVSSLVGCGGPSAGNQTLACMREANATVILNAVGTHANGSSITQFMPVYDGKTLFNDTLQRAESGNFIKKPYLIGNNDNELGILEALPGAFGSTLGGLSSSGLPAAEAEEIGNDYAFNCPAAETAASRINNSVKAWRYRYMGVWPNTALAPDIGAYHSSEIPLVFGTTELKPNATPDTPPEAALSAVMRKAWTTFAKDPENGLSKLGWPVYDPQGSTLIRLGYLNMSTPNFGNSTQYDGDCAFVDGLGVL